MDWSHILAERTRRVEFSGIRKFFEWASRMEDPCDLSIGLPDYDAPEAMKSATINAIRVGRNRYTPTAGLPELRERIASDLKHAYKTDPEVLITSGVSGGLMLALLAVLNPGDEVIFPDPYFVSYLQLVNMFGGRPIPIPIYPGFRLDVGAVEAAITPRTKAILINSPGNPTGCVMTPEEVEAVAVLARKHGLILIADEIYEGLVYEGANPSPMSFAPECTVVLRGFGKTYGVTGWRMGYAAGPAPILHEMTKFQQFTFVCAPSMAQYGTLAALDVDVSDRRRDYAEKRNLVCELLSPHFKFVRPGGGFYVFPKAPAGFPHATAFCEEAAARRVLVIPGCVFSSQDTHFRISYATSDEMIRRGCGVLCELARA